MITLVDGLIDARISKRKPNKSSQYWKLLHFLDLICLPNNWDKFSITPHILTEVCSYLRNNYSKHRHYKDIVKEVSSDNLTWLDSVSVNIGKYKARRFIADIQFCRYKRICE